MPIVTVPYGRGSLEFDLPPGCLAEVVAPAEAPPAPAPLAAVQAALDAPLGGARLAQFAGARTAAVAVNDKTRPVPHQHLLPPLLRALEGLGLPPERITVLVATGLHPPMGPDEFPAILPADILARYPVFSHDAEDAANLVERGVTTRGTPVWINRRFAEADLRVVVGNVEPHQFQGYSGGVKTAAIGLGGSASINRNHSLMFEPGARLGEFESNPARQDVEEMGARIGVHFAVNAVLNRHGKIARVLAGAPGAVLRAGIGLARALCLAPVAQPFDLMIVSPGGHPKDINLYQAQKGLAHAALVTRPGGTLILAAACPEGTGSRAYEQWMEGMTSFAAVKQRFQREGFRIGPHKAFQIARDASQAEVLLLSEMPDDLVRRLLLTPAAGPAQALAWALRRLQEGGRVGVMPHANATIPALAG